MADRDEQDHGLGSMPYPPNFPKQEGEPPRVQPSKRVASHWEDDGIKGLMDLYNACCVLLGLQVLLWVVGVV